MQAAIAAAAQSPRLLPLTSHTPVSLLEIGGRAIIDHQLESLRQAGVADTLVITGYCAEQVEERCKGKASCHFNPFYQVCHVAMHLWAARQKLGSDLVLVYGDIMFAPELVSDLLALDEDIALVIDRKGLDREADHLSEFAQHARCNIWRKGVHL